MPTLREAYKYKRVYKKSKPKKKKKLEKKSKTTIKDAVLDVLFGTNREGGPYDRVKSRPVKKTIKEDLKRLEKEFGR